MLELIVLGQIPGTQTRLSFSEVLVIWIAILLALELGLRIYRFFSVVMPRTQALGLYFALVTRR